MRDLLTYANYAKVGRALGVSKSIVQRWAKGEDVNPRRLQQVRDLLRPPAPQPVPAWVERVLTGLMALEARDGISDAERAQAQAKAIAHLAVVQPRRLQREGDVGPSESVA